MNNRDIRNYYNVLSSKIQSTSLNQKQWQEDIDFAKEKLKNKSLEWDYYKMFVDNFLVNLMNEIISKITCENEKYNKHHIIIEFKKYYDYYASAFVYLEEKSDHPVTGEVEEQFKRYGEIGTPSLLKLHDEFISKIIENISLYTKVETGIRKEIDRGIENIIRTVSFDCTIEELIDMYYVEKRDEYVNYDARKVKIK